MRRIIYPVKLVPSLLPLVFFFTNASCRFDRKRRIIVLSGLLSLMFGGAPVSATTLASVPVCWQKDWGSPQGLAVYCGSFDEVAVAYTADAAQYTADHGSQWPWTIQQVVPGSEILTIYYRLTGVPVYDQLAFWCPEGYRGTPRAFGRCTPDGGENPQKSKPPTCDADESDGATGNPCNAANGNKHAAEIDSSGLLTFERFYNSIPTENSNYQSPAKAEWRSTFDRSILLAVIPNGPTTATVRRPRGESYFFESIDGQFVPDSDIKDRLTQSGTGWTYALRDGSVETYDSSGRLLTITNAAGLSKTLNYDSAGKLATVVGPFGHTLTFGYDSNGRLSTLTDAIGAVTHYSYADKDLIRVDYPDSTAKLYHYENPSFLHHLTGISHVEIGGATTRYSTYGYNANGKAILTEHAGGVEHFDLLYDSATQTTVTDAANTQQVMTFSTNLGIKNLVGKTNSSDGKSLVQSFDSQNNLTCKKDDEGHVTTYAYNSTNQRVSMTEGLVGDCASPISNSTTRTTTYQYLSSGLDLPTLIASPSVFGGQSKTVAIAYGDTSHPNLPTLITQNGLTPSGVAISRAVSMAYTPSGQLASINGPRTDINDVTTFAYYGCNTGAACGQLQSMTNALGHVTTFDTYDGAGRLLQMTDPNGLRTSYTYDARGRVKTITQTPPSGSPRVVQYSYNAANNVTQVIQPDGVSLTYTYDAAQKLRQVTDNQGNKVVYGYDLKGNRTQEYTYDASNTLVRQIDTAYDTRNHVASINTGGSITQQLSDAIGNLTKVTDPNQVAVGSGISTNHSYDALSRLIQTIDNLSGSATFAYDINGRLTQVKVPNNAVTQYQYDDLGNLLQEISPDRGTISYTYDSTGNVTSQTDARGVVTNYTYDALNRMSNITFPAATGENITYTYDAGTTCTAGIGHLCQVTDESGTTQYAYDAFGNITTQTKGELSKTYITRYIYDNADRVLTITYPDNRVVTYARDSLGRIQSVVVTINGVAQTVTTNRTYRPDGLLLTQLFGNGVNETRQYDLQSRLTYQSVGAIDTRVYSYDPNGNLTQKQTLPEVDTYLYDSLDRLTKDTVSASSQSYTYDANGNRMKKASTVYTYTANTNRLIQTGSTAITYDATGNMVTNGSASYSYSNRGRIRQVKSGSTIKGTYTYNHLGQRTRKVAGGTTTVYHYDIGGNLILETSSTAVLKVAYLYADDVPIAQITRSATFDFLTYVHTDHEGTPRIVTGADQSVAWSWEGRAFGDSAPTGSNVMNLRFPGMYADGESGLFYNWNRYYYPRTGRYITSDPMNVRDHVRKWMTAMHKGSFNAPPLELSSYAYVNDNPSRWIDPTGLETLMCSKLWHPHTFLCVDGTCSGKYPSGNPFFSSGEIRDDAPNQSKASCSAVPVPDGCDGGAFDQCVITRLLQRGSSGDMYNLSGQNCGTWAEEVITSCRNACMQRPTSGAK